jgi:hypothetical protein
VGLAVVGLLGGCVVGKGPTPGQVERRVRAEVPLGSTQQEVETWLRRKSIEFVTIQGAPEVRIGNTRVEDRLGDTRVVDMAGLGDRPIGATIRATVAPALVSLVWDGEVKVYFFFDAAGLLIGYAFVPWAHAL